MLSLLLVLSPSAYAHDDAQQEHCAECLYEDLAAAWEDDHDTKRGPDSDWDLVGASGMVWFGDDASPWAHVAIEDLYGLYARVEGRAHPDRKWMGRISTGFDFLPGEREVDVTLGLYAGNAAVWNTIDDRTTQIGTEVGVALNIDRTHARVRWLGGPNSRTKRLRRETIWTLGYRVLGPIELQAQAVTINPGLPRAQAKQEAKILPAGNARRAPGKETGLGLSAALVF